MENFIAGIMRRTLATPDSVARVVRAKTPPLRVCATLDAYLFSALRRFLPRRFYHWLLYRNLPSARQWGQH